MIIWERRQTSLRVCCNIYGPLMNVINHEANTKRRQPGRDYKDTDKLALERERYFYDAATSFISGPVGTSN